MAFVLRLCLGLLLLAPTLVHAAVLENPSGGLSYSGIGVVSGWKCDADGALTVRFFDVDMLPLGGTTPLAYRNERADTAGVCGDTDNGFVSIWNWANLGDGTFTAIVYDNGVEFGRSTFRVTTLGEEFVRGARGECTIDDFPASGESARFAWNQATQGLVLIPNPPPLEFPLRALHIGTNLDGTPTNVTVEQWEAAGRTGPLIPLDYIAWLQSLHVNWIGLSVALHYDDSMDSTVEPVTSSDVDVPTYSDARLRQLLREFRSHGINVYLTLAFEAMEALTAARPVDRGRLGDPGDPQTGTPVDVQGISPEFWPWRPSHPDHRQFVAEFWETYTQQAVYYARLAEEEGVGLYSLGTETDMLFRTRSDDGYWVNHFREELQDMVRRVRAVYTGALTYDMHYNALTHDFFHTGSEHLWEDLDLDIVGLSAYIRLTDAPPSTVLSVEELQASYEQIFQDYLLPLAARNPDRPIVFLEYAVTEEVEAPYSTGLWTQGLMFVFSDADGNGLDDAREAQANVYQALLNTLEQFPGLVNGVFWWENSISSEALWELTKGGMYRTYDIRNKPIEESVRSAYESYKNR